jgi:hypothetical protein
LFVYEALVFHLEVFVVWKRIFSMFYWRWNLQAGKQYF